MCEKYRPRVFAAASTYVGLNTSMPFDKGADRISIVAAGTV